MPKIVAIQDHLKDIGKELEARGYEVVHENYDGYVDAILYDSDYGRLSYLGNFDSVIDMDKGAIVINIKNKRIDEIIYAIEKRTYESLF
ncbi:YkuS family protein [Crassaminicella indica]|uniref:YkuS family protein n=1 Tax=Crassaminicella indica TaxID=2855394 RepID=A0ABX8REX8_9CLOT|nr:YkuS family protein [Crassaminicella indica]QXM07007.1 YkuS family protein [Crassaminicella indica]